MCTFLLVSRRLMCPKFTYFGPDVRGTLVEGCDFHKFYFDQGELTFRISYLFSWKRY